MLKAFEKGFGLQGLQNGEGRKGRKRGEWRNQGVRIGCWGCGFRYEAGAIGTTIIRRESGGQATQLVRSVQG